MNINAPATTDDGIHITVTAEYALREARSALHLAREVAQINPKGAEALCGVANVWQSIAYDLARANCKTGDDQ